MLPVKSNGSSLSARSTRGAEGGGGGATTRAINDVDWQHYGCTKAVAARAALESKCPPQIPCGPGGANDN